MSANSMSEQISSKQGFIAALDQSGGSTPGALRQYGIPDSAYTGETEMFRLMHAMRERVMTAPAFDGNKVIAAILFEGTMNGLAKGKPVPAYLWEDRGVVPFLKIDKGLEAESDGVQLMKAMPALDSTLERAAALGIFGTKMRSVIRLASKTGIAAIVGQQFAAAERIMRHGLLPIIEPEISIGSLEKAAAEDILLEELLTALDAVPAGQSVVLKLTLPDVADHYGPLTRHGRVARVVALSGGYPLDAACERLSSNHDVIASFSRALLDDLRQSMSEAEFDATLAAAVGKIYQASTQKR